VVSHWR